MSDNPAAIIVAIWRLMIARSFRLTFLAPKPGMLISILSPVAAADSSRAMGDRPIPLNLVIADESFTASSLPLISFPSELRDV